MQFTTLAHLIDEEFLREAFGHIKKKAAAGVDGVTAKEYAEALDANIADLYQRMRSGCYKAPPVRRVWLEKDDGKQRPIGIPALEDKVLQRAVTMLVPPKNSIHLHLRGNLNHLGRGLTRRISWLDEYVEQSRGDRWARPAFHPPVGILRWDVPSGV